MKNIKTDFEKMLPVVRVEDSHYHCFLLMQEMKENEIKELKFNWYAWYEQFDNDARHRCHCDFIVEDFIDEHFHIAIDCKLSHDKIEHFDKIEQFIVYRYGKNKKDKLSVKHITSMENQKI